jgi:ubiquitin C-terminal hydrolase
VHRSICSFPKFFFIQLIREVWNIDHIKKDCRSIAFPLKLNMDAYTPDCGINTHYQLAAVIAHLGDPDPNRGHNIAFLRIFGQWIRFNDTQVDFVNESNALEDNFPENEESTQTAIILLYVVDD